jgi:hypothetical protein
VVAKPATADRNRKLAAKPSIADGS